MPIHDQSYRRYGGSRAPIGQAWAVIARHGVLTIVRKRLFLGLLLGAWIPFVVGAVTVTLSTTVSASVVTPPDPVTWRVTVPPGATLRLGAPLPERVSMMRKGEIV